MNILSKIKLSEYFAFVPFFKWKIKLPRRIWFSKRRYDFISVRIKAAEHHKLFEKYKNCHAGKDVIIVGSGPSVNKYKPLPGIYMGVNYAFKLEHLNFSYLFVHDYLKDKMTDFHYPFFMYKPETCHKFYGISSLNFLNDRFQHLPFDFSFYPNTDYFYLDSIQYFRFPFDIASEPFGEYYGTVFSALQFALYTHPKRIFLVGFDCTSGHFDNEKDHSDLSYQYDSWIMFQKYARDNFPSVEIISVNPVGLKGLFTDLEQDKGNTPISSPLEKR